MSDLPPPLVRTIGCLCLALPALMFVHTLADAAITVVAVLFLVVSWRGNDFAWARQPWVILGLAFWAFAIARGVVSETPGNSAPLALVWIRFIVFVAAMQMVAQRWPGFPRLMLWSLATFSLLGAADTILQFFLGHDAFGRPKLNDGQRLTGPLSDARIGLLLLLMGLPALALMMARASDRTQRLSLRTAALGGVLLLAAAIFLSGERMSLLLLGAALIVCAILVARPSWPLATGLAAGAIGTAAAFYATFPQVWQRHVSILSPWENPTDAHYLDIWRTAWKMFVDNPIFGVGIHNYREACMRYAARGDVCEDLQPHQFWLEWLAETGLVGTCLLVLMFAAALRIAVGRWREWHAQPLLAGATIAVLLRLWPLATTHSFFINQNEVVFWTMVAVAVAAGGRSVSRPTEP